jgi:hypothetical protein
MKQQKVHEIVKRQLTAIVCTAFATFASVDAKADTIWVDVANYGTAGLTGATKALAYGTIQDAFGLFRSAVFYFSISSRHVSCGAEEAGMKGWRERAAGMRNVCRAAFAVVGFLI